MMLKKAEQLKPTLESYEMKLGLLLKLMSFSSVGVAVDHTAFHSLHLG